MLDERPLINQSLDDVLQFLEQGIGENLTLDYKREISPESDKDKAELCKDVSALANSAGGMIIYGVGEKKPERSPELPPYGIPRSAGRQAVEEWAAQVLASGVQPRMDFEVGVYSLETRGLSGDGGDERCIMIVRTPSSPFAPHMVTFRADNRYYGRFYRRGNYESRIAQEYEVREMLERARRLYEGIAGEISRRGYADPSSTSFGNNVYASRLVTRFSQRTEAAIRDHDDLRARRITVLLLPIASSPANEALRQNRREWVSWLDPNERHYEPEPNGLFVPREVRQPTLGGIACLRHFRDWDGTQTTNKGLDEYLIIGFDGTVELGFSSAIWQRENWGMLFAFKGMEILARTWQAVNFTADVRRRLGLVSSYVLLVNVKNTYNGILTDFHRDWLHRDPASSAIVDLEDAPLCLETNVQIRRELSGEDFEDISLGTRESPSEQIRDLAEELSSAFGLQDPVLLPRTKVYTSGV